MLTSLQKEIEKSDLLKGVRSPYDLVHECVSEIQLSSESKEAIKAGA